MASASAGYHKKACIDRPRPGREFLWKLWLLLNVGGQEYVYWRNHGSMVLDAIPESIALTGAVGIHCRILAIPLYRRYACDAPPHFCCTLATNRVLKYEDGNLGGLQ